MNCWKCGVLLKTKNLEKMPFRERCEACDIPLHCCKNCAYYKINYPNNCLIPHTEFIRDREAQNFCEDFKCLIQSTQKKIPNIQDIENRLFKES